MYWVFTDTQLANALTHFEERRKREGASEQQAKDETNSIVQFLTSPEAAKLVGGKAAA
jgi:hypothetical protein